MDKSNEQDQYKKGYEDAKDDMLLLIESVKNELANKAKEVPIRKGFFWDGKAFGYIDAINTIYETIKDYDKNRSILDCARAIKRFCKESIDCKGCSLHDKDDYNGCSLCKLDKTPEYWTFDESEETE